MMLLLIVGLAFVEYMAPPFVAEFEIPFRSVRYLDGATEWGINFTRLDLKSSEKSSWAPVPSHSPQKAPAFSFSSSRDSSSSGTLDSL